MENFIKYVHINNFKSIADLRLEDCRRINLFIGYPNVGKSNVLEALGLFSVPFLKVGENLDRLVRAEHLNELFHNAWGNSFDIETNIGKLRWTDNYIHIYFPGIGDGVYGFSSNLNADSIHSSIKNSIVKRYTFQTKNNWHSNGDSQLLPPFGENIIDTLSYNHTVSDVKTWIKQEFTKFRLENVLDKTTDSLRVQRRLNEDEVFQLPYSSIADTLQRLIFYKTAIASNKNSVLLFEEPEAHAFPPYIQEFTHDIADAKTNQFFIVTHSPFILDTFLESEHLRRETSIYLFDYKNDQTTVKRLTDEEMDEVYNYGMDLFFNIESFLRDE